MRTMNPMNIPAVDADTFITAIERRLGRPIADSEREFVEEMTKHNWPVVVIVDELTR